MTIIIRTDDPVRLGCGHTEGIFGRMTRCDAAGTIAEIRRDDWSMVSVRCDRHATGDPSVYHSVPVTSAAALQQRMAAIDLLEREASFRIDEGNFYSETERLEYVALDDVAKILRSNLS